jgi:two-component system, LytTR family, response regulator
MTLRAIIVDDEPLARQRIRDLLASADVLVVAECEDGLQGLQAISEQHPDLVFLDVQMPGVDGFELLRLLDPPRPMIVFTTAFEAYAVRAFDEHALDYLLKPVDAARFRESLARATARTRDDWSERLGGLLARLERQPRLLRRVVVKTPGRVFFVETRDIDWFEAAANYVRVHTAAGETHIVRMTMQTLEQSLDPRAFARIHRGTIVNVARVAELQAGFRGQYDVVLKSGARLPMQRAYHDRLRAALGDF